MFLSLSKCFDLLFGIYFFALVTECYFDFFYKFIPILGIIIVFYLFNILLSINASYAPSKLCQYCSDLVICCSWRIILYTSTNLWILSSLHQIILGPGLCFLVLLSLVWFLLVLLVSILLIHCLMLSFLFFFLLRHLL